VSSSGYNLAGNHRPYTLGGYHWQNDKASKNRAVAADVLEIKRNVKLVEGWQTCRFGKVGLVLINDRLHWLGRDLLGMIGSFATFHSTNRKAMTMTAPTVTMPITRALFQAYVEPPNEMGTCIY